MERNRSKSKMPVHSEIFALGKNIEGKGNDRKREASSSGTFPMKKPKVIQNPTHSMKSESTLETLAQWEEIATDCEYLDIVPSVLQAMEQQDSDKIVSIICGSVRALTLQKLKLDHSLMLSLMYLAKLRPHIFCNEIITTALVSILKKESVHSYKSKTNNNLSIFVTNLLARGYHDKKKWPETFFKLYVEDAINERAWVDNEECSYFIDNIICEFNTKIPPKWLLHPEITSGSSTSFQKEGSSIVLEDESMDSTTSHSSSRHNEEFQSRYYHMREELEKYTIEIIKEQFNRRQPDLMTRNFLKFVSTCCGLSEVRALAIPRIEFWIHNAKLFKPAHELLIYIIYNVTEQTSKDQEVLCQLMKIRLKNKPSINIFMTSLKELINSQPNILPSILKYVVQNELSNSRNPNNMGILAAIFQAKPEKAATHLAEIYQDFLLQKDDCLKTLRVFLRELVKTLRYDINLIVFCKSLMNHRPEFQMHLHNFEFKERVCFAIADLVCLSRFLSVSPQIREANSNSCSAIRGEHDQKITNIVYNFYNQMAQIQCDSLIWMLESVPKLFKISSIDYAVTLHKILLMEVAENYVKGDQWPPEAERVVFLRLVSEVPLLEDSIWRVILIGITKEIPFSIPDSIEVIEHMVRKAGSLKFNEFQPLKVDRLDLIDFLFSMAEYHHPDNIILPSGYEPPKLAISALYWKIWIILLILSAHNVSTIGSFCWSQYPILKMLMEMCITNQFTPSKMTEDELQLVLMEKNQIIEFECHLAAQTSKIQINEQTSLLVAQVMLMEPMGVPRRPPKPVLEQLQILNQTHRLGHLLCRCRKPDLLLDIIQKQGTSNSMPWIADLVSSSGDFNHLPVQCLCEFLLSNISSSFDNTRDNQLIIYLQKLLCDSNNDYQSSCEVLEYFLRRLSSTTKGGRQSAIKSLKLLLKNLHPDDDEEMGGEGKSDEDDFSWLLKYLPSVPFFQYVNPIIISQLRSAVQIETNTKLIMSYIQFIASHTINDQITDMVEHIMDMSLLIVERSSIFMSIIPIESSIDDDPLYDTKLQTLNCLFVMFNNFLIKMKENESPTITIPEYPDLITVNFADGTQCHMHLHIIHALIILFINSSGLTVAHDLLEFLFPTNGPLPKARSLANDEPVQIFPDWLKLKMIRSNSSRLVDIALQDITADQIILFVQNFGTPVASMSKLLALLDRIVVEDPNAINSVYINKNYVAQLIEVQRKRGAKNGHISISALCSQACDTMKTNKSSVAITGLLPASQFAEISSTKKDVSEAFVKKIPSALLNLYANNITTEKLRMHQMIMNVLLTQSKLGTDRVNVEKTLNDDNFLKILNRELTSSKNTTKISMAFSLYRTIFCKKPSKFLHQSYTIDNSIIKSLEKSNCKTGPFYELLLNKKKYLIGKNRASKSSYYNSKNAADFFINLIDSRQLFTIESTGKSWLRKNVDEKILSVIVESLSTKLMSNEDSNIVQTMNGLMIDWLVESDSELMNVSDSIQMTMLFGKTKKVFRPFLLSLLIHQSNWKTISVSLQILLNHQNVFVHDPTSVLDFVIALTKNPKLWQGREKSITKHEQSEKTFILSEHQILALTDYILLETKSSSSDKLSKRVNELLHLVDANNIDLKCIIRHVLRKSSVKEMETARNFLQHVYINIPSLKFMDCNLDKFFNESLLSYTTCKFDQFSHTIVTLLSSLSNVKEWQQMGQEIELLVRKMASSHKTLVLREIALLATLLQGKSHMDLHVLRAEHHFSMFHKVLGILELLKPQIFEDVYCKSLHNALDSYFTLIKNQFHSKEMYSILYRLMDFVQSYAINNPSSAFKIIEAHSDLFHILLGSDKNFPAVQQLVQGLMLMKQKSERNAEASTSDDKNSTSVYNPIVNLDAKFDSVPQQWISLSNYLKKSQDDFSNTLVEIEAITYKRPFLLAEIFDKLLELIFSLSADVRNTAHSLILRFLRHNPGNPEINASCLRAYMECLKSDDNGICSSVIEFLPEIILALQEFSIDLLQIAFNLGITSKLNTINCLRKCILHLNYQQAC